MYRRIISVLAIAGLTLSLAGCAAVERQHERMTKRDKTKKGAAIGAGAGAVLGAVLGEGELDEILAGAAIGAGIGAGIGAYMDKQEEKLAQIPGTTVERLDDDMLLVHFESDVLFAVNSSTLETGSRAALEQAAAIFGEFPKTAIIAQGHTDSTGSDEYNQSLSEPRAYSVVDYLQLQRVAGERITAQGYGEQHSIADNTSPSGRRQNRRVDLLLKGKAR